MHHLFLLALLRNYRHGMGVRYPTKENKGVFMVVGSVERQPGSVFSQNVVLPNSSHSKGAKDVFEKRKQTTDVDHAVPQQFFVNRFCQWLRPFFVPPTARGKKLVIIGGASSSVGVFFSMGLLPALGFFVGCMSIPLLVERFSERNS